MKNTTSYKLSIYLLCSVLLISCFSGKKPVAKEVKVNAPELDINKDNWVDSVLNSMSLPDKVGQLFMVAVFSEKSKMQPALYDKLVQEDRVGGICFFAGGPIAQSKLTNKFQSMAKVPLLISIDGEWGLNMRLDSTIRYPRQMTLAAMEDEKMIYEMGRAIGRQCKRIGIHMNLAPDADINSNPLNPVIGSRSFGDSKMQVARKAVLYAKGMQDEGILTCAKHFPGHGDTDADSHLGLPTIKHSKQTIDTLDLVPFKELFKSGVSSVMVAHLFIPALDTTTNLASTLSTKVVNDYLKNKMGYKGLIITDALNMKGVSSYYAPGEVDLMAYMAGNDILLYPEDVAQAKIKILSAIEDGRVSEMDLNARVRKILSAKYDAGLNNLKPIDANSLVDDLNKPLDQLLNQKLCANAVTVLRNDNNCLPIKSLDNLYLASIVVGDKADVPFAQMLSKFAPMSLHRISLNPTQSQIDTLLSQISGYNGVIVSIHNTNTNPSKNFGITENLNQLINRLRSKKLVVVDVFGNAYAASKLESAHLVPGFILSYEGSKEMQEAAAQVIFGALPAKGSLPVTLGSKFKRGVGFKYEAINRLAYTMPEELGYDSKKLAGIDKIVADGISQKAFPGCQVMVVKSGKVIFDKAYGYHTYEKKVPVKPSDIYDIASVSKIAGTNLGLMKLFDDGKLPLDKTLADISVQWSNYSTGSIKLSDLLTHQAGLPAFKPFWKETMDGNKLSPKFYVEKPDSLHHVLVANKIYASDAIPVKIKEEVMRLIPGEKKYVYSDFSMILSQWLLEDLTKSKMEVFLQENFYRSLGMATLGYKPAERFSITRIPPTENDQDFRKQLVWGFVHDPTAALMGGVAGHAGIFSNANDLAKLAQMWLNNGTYAGHTYLKPSTIKTFTSSYSAGNRRGLGFDKAEPDPAKSSPVCKDASVNTYGHQGFTGTCIWVDPDNQLTYIFLSNRVNPKTEPNKLAQIGTRTEIQKLIYEVIKGK